MDNIENAVIIGITGGIGSGKTAVANLFREKGFMVLSSDDIAKELMASDNNLKSRLMDAFGADVYQDDGTLNREFLAEKVFADTPAAHDNLKKLNSIVHPAVIDCLIERMEKAAEDGHTHIFVESALMIESGMADGYDYIIVVKAPEDIVINRVKKRSGLNEEQIKRRMKNQLPPEEKAKYADFVIDNSGDLDKLKGTVNFLAGIVKSLKQNNHEEDDD